MPAGVDRGVDLRRASRWRSRRRRSCPRRAARPSRRAGPRAGPASVPPGSVGSGRCAAGSPRRAARRRGVRRLSSTPARSSAGRLRRVPAALRRRGAAPTFDTSSEVVGVRVQRLVDQLVGHVGPVVLRGVDVVRPPARPRGAAPRAPSSRSRGGPNTPGPGSCMAPKPIRADGPAGEGAGRT